MSEHKIVLTTCARDCPDACGINAHVTGGRLVGLLGARDHEITRNFLCRKAINYIHRVYSPDRLLKPLRKVDGGWQEMGWDEALDRVAAVTKETIEQYGSLGILHYQSGGSLAALKMLNKRFFNLLGGVTEAVGSLCGGAGIAGQIMDFGYRTSHDPLDLLNSRLILLWGRNPSETNTHLVPILKDARARGAKVILIDPVKTDTAKFCDAHVSPRPGMDGYLALGMAKAIIESGKADAQFIADHCEQYDAYRALVDGYDMEFLGRASGVSVEQMGQLAKAYTNWKPAAIVLGWGLQRYRWGAQAFRLIDALGAISGNIGVPGGGVNHGRDEKEYFDQSVRGNEFAKQRRTVPKPLLAKSLPELTDPPVRLAFINAGNPMNQSPDTPALIEAFKNVECTIVFEQFMTDTAARADIVLPVTTFVEETDVVASYWHSVIGAVNPAIEPVGGVKSDFEIYQELANRLGIGAEMAGTADEWIAKIIAPLKSAGITLAALRERHIRNTEVPAVPFSGGAFKHASGKFNFITSFSTDDFATGEYPLVLLTPHTRRWVHSQVLPAEHTNSPVEAAINPATASAYGIDDGNPARITSSLGSISVVVRYSDRVKEGVVSVTQGRWMAFDQSVNHITPAIMSDEGQNACYYQTAVRIEKIDLLR